jgi:hypothetical protein
MNIKKEFVAVILPSKEKIRSYDGTTAGDPFITFMIFSVS